MRHLVSAMLLMWAAAPLSAGELQMLKTRPDLELARNDQQMGMLAPSLRDWVSARARLIVDSEEEFDPEAIAGDATARLAGQDFSTADVEVLVQLVLAESARQADADLQDMMEQMRTANQRKAELREAATAQRAQSKAISAQTRAEYAQRQAIPSCAEPPCQPQLVLVKPRPELAAVSNTVQLRPQLQPQAELDSQSDLSEMNSMRLQALLDRRAKLFETLSNLIKKNSDTASTITSNLK